MAYKATADVQLSDYVVDLERDGGTIDPLLYDLLTIASPHKSTGEDAVRDRIAEELQSFRRGYDIDKVGNLIVRIGKRRKHRTLFSCHMDTVHDVPGEVKLVMTQNAPDPGQDDMVYGMMRERPIRYRVGEEGDLITYTELRHVATAHGLKFFRIAPLGADRKFYRMEKLTSLNDKNGVVAEEIPPIEKVVMDAQWVPSVLGADDKLGCYIMLRMIEAGIQGTYIFHVGEEVGTIGSTYILEKTSHVLKDIDRAIAFDRMNYGDVIGSQGGTCASGEFCKALADELNQYMPSLQHFTPSVRGVFTDTATYMDDVPECTNLSVGYFNQHTENEHFDLLWLECMLLPALLKVDWQSLPTKRDPKAVKTSYYRGNSYLSGCGGYGGWGGAHWWDDDVDWVNDPNNPAGDDEEDEDSESYVVGPPNTKPKDWLDAEKFWEEMGYEAPWNVSPYTPWSKIPTWVPEQGIWSICSEEQMRLIMRKHLATQKKPIEEATKILFETLQELEVLKNEIIG